VSVSWRQPCSQRDSTPLRGPSRSPADGPPTPSPKPGDALSTAASQPSQRPFDNRFAGRPTVRGGRVASRQVDATKSRSGRPWGPRADGASRLNTATFPSALPVLTFRWYGHVAGRTQITDHLSPKAIAPRRPAFSGAHASDRFTAWSVPCRPREPSGLSFADTMVHFSIRGRLAAQPRRPGPASGGAWRTLPGAAPPTVPQPILGNPPPSAGHIGWQGSHSGPRLAPGVLTRLVVRDHNTGPQTSPRRESFRRAPK
jgi:hypothetical protein